MAEKPVALGFATFAFVDPHPGHERDFNRWYERDHIFALGAAPFTLATQRWVATLPLKQLRYPQHSAIIEPVERGSYLAGYWVQAGKLEAQERWFLENVAEAAAPERSFEHRDNLGSTTFDYLGGALRDADGVPPELALDHRYAGMVWTWLVREPEVSLEQATSWLLDEELPGALEKSPVAMSLVFTPRNKPDWYPPHVPDVPGVGERLLVLSFVECDPRDCWEASFAGRGARIDSAGKARTLLVAPFIPTVPGTDRYVDEL